MNIKLLDEREYKYCSLFGLVINPRFAYISRDDWYSHLQSFNHPKLDRLFRIINKHNKNGLNYKHLSNHLYDALIEKSELSKEK